jgi:hypothetical protein
MPAGRDSPVSVQAAHEIKFKFNQTAAQPGAQAVPLVVRQKKAPEVPDTAGAKSGYGQRWADRLSMEDRPVSRLAATARHRR